jgi:crotonobetainyl-CoA:carnitine CoA-transferase CaiB-like acyl-CoA transferase
MPLDDATDGTPPSALSGIRVIELGRVLAAPFCGQLLGDAGADVIKIEIPGEGDESRSYGPPFIDGQSYYFLSLNRNKRSLTLNLKHASASELLHSLLATADVFLHNSLPGPIERLGFDYDTVQRINPRIVYCAISGFGQVGPERDRPALDMMAQAESGIMSLTGEPSGAPMRAGVPIADLATGMLAAYGISLALLQRQQTGHGQMVDTSLLEASLSLVSYQAVRYLLTGEAPRRLGNAHPSIVPYDTYQSADGWIAIAVVNDGIWERFCSALDLQALAQDPRFANNPARVRNRAELDKTIKPTLHGLTTAELVSRLRAANVPHAEVRDVAAALAGPQAEALQLLQPSSHPRTSTVQLMASPVHLSGSSAGERYAPPHLGEHTEEILRELDIGDEVIARLRAEGAI